ncbi:non-ribosomal peptide synthetase [Algibacter mikhailovii]|uniref:non-ribosomal peptide synthetase n=1 Tax=Algibacter mikhailovii TaxID=425498 RepID=UPI002494F972|nr:amino acid adenylation domain-containing protein [Algibacter mikhailovii]
MIKTKNLFNPFLGPGIQKVVHITKPQEEIWIACKIGEEDANRSYNLSISLNFTGDFNKIAMEHALQQLVVRHESFRSVFSPDGRFMIVFEDLPLATPYQDISQLNTKDKNNFIKNYISSDANYIFNLEKGPLLKVNLLKLSELEHQLVLTIHHIVCDGWSFGVILDELGGLYSEFVLGKKHELPSPETFSSFADFQFDFIESEASKKTENFWLEQYNASVPQVNLPTDFSRPQLRTYKGDHLEFSIDRNISRTLKRTGIQAGCSFVTTLLVAFEVFLYGQTGQDDLVVGLPAAGQSLSGKNQLIGHCVNLLPLRSKLNNESSFIAYLKKRKAELFDAYDHQQFSFGQLLQKISLARDPSRVPLVPVVFNIELGMTEKVSFAGLTFNKKTNPREFETFEIFLNATGTEDDLLLEWSFNASLFKPETIKKMMTSFNEVLSSIVSNPDIKIGDIIKIDNSAYLKLNETMVQYPQLPLHELLSEQGLITPLNKAIKIGDSQVSYEDLEVQVNQLTHYLIEKGIGNGDYVGVSLPRSIELVVTLIAIMKCGAAYLPLDPKYPSNRLEFMLEDSDAKYLITGKSLLSQLNTNSEILLFEEVFKKISEYPNTQPDIPVTNNDIAYLLYTSGSTGKPKGVPVTHKNLVNFLFSMIEEPGIKESDKLLSITTISFDIAGLELFTPLLTGALLVLTNEETARDSRLLLDLMKDEAITIMQATPTTWQMLLDIGWEEPLPIKALCGGEALPMVLAKNILHRVDELWNMYGPTETTVWSSVKQISKSDDLISVGRPIANTQIYIINEQNGLVAQGKTGELCIAGDGVAQGYWKREDLTKEKFINNPFEQELGPILYRTGDLAKLLPSGEIQCLGRIDQQIKIRGHRIELGEIEEALDSLPGVQSSVVVLYKDNLVANLIPSDLGDQSKEMINTWKETLRKQLPPHMVPQQFNLLSEFPTTLNGKIDRKTLSNSLSLNQKNQEFNEAETDSEQIIAAIWQECLKIDKIDIHSDFFELGGHSLLAVKAMSILEKQTGNRLPLASLIEHPTIQKLAHYLDKKYVSWDSLVPLQPNGTKTPLFIVHGANHNILIYKNLAERLDKDQPVYALQAKGLSGEDEPHSSVEDMAAHYISEIQTINPEGPYALAGFSFGGIIAFEMTKQLRAQGKTVKNLALFDSYVYPHYSYTNSFVKKSIIKLYNICQLNFMLFNMFSSKKNFNRRYDLLKIKFSGLKLRFKHGKEKQYQIQFNRTAKIDEMQALAATNYNLYPQDIKVDLFRSTEDIYFAHDYKYLGWQSAATKGIRKHMVPGNHSDMFFQPAVEGFAKDLQHVLNTYNLED